MFGIRNHHLRSEKPDSRRRYVRGAEIARSTLYLAASRVSGSLSVSYAAMFGLDGTLPLIGQRGNRRRLIGEYDPQSRLQTIPTRGPSWAS